MAALKLILGLLILCWLGFAAFLYFSQGSLLYHPRPADAMAETQLMNTLPDVQPFLVATKDGQSLAGWYLPRKRGRGPAPALVYFGGNAEEVTDFMKQATNFADVSVVAVNYRGYGRSTGVPSEAALKDDALAIFDQAVALTGGQGFVMGRSLGSGLAVHVAAYREVLGAVLVTPYDSILAVAKSHYPFMPVSWLLKETYDAVPDADKALSPALVLAGTQDDVVPEARARALFDKWKGPKQFAMVTSAGHNDINDYPRYGEAIKSFLRDNSR